MIQLEPNSANVVILSVLDLLTISSPTYLFRFVSKDSKEEYVCISAAVTTYSLYRQSFVITTVASSPVSLSGEIALVLGDEYNYYVYAQTSTTNLDYTLADELLEQGMMRYNKTITQREVYERTPTTRKVYTRS